MENRLQTRKYIHELDYIRAISALFIILFHYTTQYQTSFGHAKPWPVSVPWGSWAVNTFFLLTGYLTVCHYSEGGLRFAGKRLIRLWPAFAVCVVITSLFMAVLLPERLRSVSEIIRNLTMFPGYLGARAVDGVYWTLPVEILFYFWIMLMMIGKKTGRLMACLYSWALMSITAAMCAKAGILALPVKLLQILLIVEHAPCFILGTAIHLFNAGDARQKKMVTPLIVLCVVGTASSQNVAVAIWTLCWALLIWAVTAEKLHFALKPSNPLHKGITFFASISYTVYLLHQFIGFAIIHKIETMGGYSQLWIFAPIAVVILLATAVHYLVEVPAGKFLMRFLPKSKTNN